jgi:hypothetical protein
MRFTTRAALAVLLVLGACASIGCGDNGTEVGKDHLVSPMKYLWSGSFGDANAQYAGVIATDASGSVIIAGNFRGTVDFGGGALASAGDYDIYVAKLGSSGAHIWSKRFGDASQQVAQGIAVDAAGNVFVAGYFEGTIDFGGGALTSAGLRDVYIAKFASDGSYIWSKRFGDASYQAANALALDSYGNVVITGVFMGTVDFGGGALTGAGGWDIFMAKFDSNGTHLWSKRFGDGSHQYAPAVAIDASSNVIVAGYFQGAVDFGGGALTSAGGEDIYVAKFDSGGAHLWSKRIGDANDAQEAWAVAVDASGNVIVTGYFMGNIDFGGGALASAGGADIFIAKLDSDGAHLWSKRFGDGSNQYCWDVAVDSSGNLVLVGSFYGAVDFGGGGFGSVGSNDVFIAKLESDGDHLVSRRFGDAYHQEGRAVAVNASDNTFIAGYFEGTVDFGGGALTSAGQEDIYIAKFGR